jgi:hypothetical protein
MDLLALSREIAEYLDGWLVSLDHCDHYVTLRRVDDDDPDIGLRIGKDSHQRIKVYGLYPMEFYRWEETPRITCSTKREPESIAGDIVRRFLPDYHEALEAALNMRYRERRRKRLRMDALENLAEILQAGIMREGDNPRIYNLPGDARLYRIHAYVGDVGTPQENITVNMELSHISFDVARAICKILAE